VHEPDPVRRPLYGPALSPFRVCSRPPPTGNVPPLFHCFGLVLGNLAAWTHGTSIVYAAPTFNAAAAVDAVLAERCTALHGVPTHFLGVLAEVERREREQGAPLDFSRLRCVRWFRRRAGSVLRAGRAGTGRASRRGRRSRFRS
jgi:acyl-CoA synthetase (AMP-forming)/AMP-acid ligase II